MTSNTDKDLLAGWQKEQIMAAMDFFGEPFKGTEKRSALDGRLSDYIRHFPATWLSKLLESDLRLMKDICSQGPDGSIVMPEPDLRGVAENLGIIIAQQENQYDMRFSLASGFWEIVAPEIDSLIEYKEQDGSFQIERTVLGILNTYGALPLRTFIDIIFGEDNSDLLINDFTAMVADCPLVRLHQEYYKGTIYLVSPFVDNFDELMSMRRISFKEVRKYAKLNKENAISTGTGSPWCAYGMDTAEGQNLKEMLTTLGYSGETLKATIHEIWINSQYALDDDATAALFGPVSDRQEDISSFQMYKDCIDAITEYANSVPKWLLKGNTANEANLMKISVRVSDLEDEFSQDKDLILYQLGLAVKPVGAFDPCPCGSGLSYCHCHGRFKS